MNKVFNINLGNFPLTIDEDAYRHLENYLQSLHNHFRNSEGYEEIMNDIEARLGELMREGMGKRAIATMQDVKNAVSVMGTPEDFGAESIDETAQKSKSSSSSKSYTDGTSRSSREGGIKTGKRLFRDEENKVVGGVCSGIAAYFGIEDPLWVRLAFAGMFFLFGTSLGLYIILMMIIPKATTTADRLAMKGEPIDVNSIAKAVEEGVENFSKKVNEFGNPENQAKYQSQIHHASAQVGNVIQLLLKGMGGFWKIIVFGIIVGLIVALLVSWVTGAISLTMAYPFFDYITDSNTIPVGSIMAAFGVVSIPVVLLILFMRRLISKQPTSMWLSIGLWIVWFACASVLGAMASKTIREFNHKAEFTQAIDLANPNVETLDITFFENPNGDLPAHFGDIQISEDFLLIGDTYLRIEKSNSDKFELSKTLLSRGRTVEEARQLCSAIDFKIESTNNDLRIPNDIQISEGTKYRGQHVNLLLKMPVGKKVKIKRNGNGRIDVQESRSEDDEDNNDLCWFSNDDDIALWEMTEKGMKCLNK